MVNITWSLSNGGAAISDYVDHGQVSNGNSSTAEEIFLNHDGAAVITGVALYIREFSGTYNGDATATADFAELIAWGDASTAATFGGIQINWDNANLSLLGAYDSGNWPTFAAKTPTYGMVHATGVGDSDENAVTLPLATGVTNAGQLDIGAAPNVAFQMRVQVPSDEDTVGVRLWDQVIKYNYTS